MISTATALREPACWTSSSRRRPSSSLSSATAAPKRSSRTPRRPWASERTSSCREVLRGEALPGESPILENRFHRLPYRGCCDFAFWDEVKLIRTCDWRSRSMNDNNVQLNRFLIRDNQSLGIIVSKIMKEKTRKNVVDIDVSWSFLLPEDKSLDKIVIQK